MKLPRKGFDFFHLWFPDYQSGFPNQTDSYSHRDADKPEDPMTHKTRNVSSIKNQDTLIQLPDYQSEFPNLTDSYSHRNADKSEIPDSKRQPKQGQDLNGGNQ